MANLIVTSNMLGDFATNCYTIFNQDTREAVIIDPGDRADFLIDTYKSQRYKPVAILLTHGHLDHIGAVPGLLREYPQLTVYAGKEEKDVLADTRLNLSAMFGNPMTIEADKYVDEADVIELLGTKIRCFHVPGHTKGGTCYYFEEQAMLFSGDTLFAGSIGRSDFPTGDERALLDNIERKLFTLPEDVIVYPGHNSKTSIKREKLYNPYF